MNGIGLGVIVSDQQGRFRVLLHIQIVSGVDGRGIEQPSPRYGERCENDYDDFHFDFSFLVFLSTE